MKLADSIYSINHEISKYYGLENQIVSIVIRDKLFNSIKDEFINNNPLIPDKLLGDEFKLMGITFKGEEMKKLVIEDKQEGLLALLGETITIFTSGYFYHGKLIGVNDTCVKLENPSIIYETGSFKDTTFKDIQSLNTQYWYVANPAIESFGLMK